MSNLSLESRRDDFLKHMDTVLKHVVICSGTGCIANGAIEVFEAFKAAVEKSGLKISVAMEKEAGGVHVSKSGCQGFCQMGPLLTNFPDEIVYTKVKPEDVAEIIEKSILKGEIIDRLLYEDIRDGKKSATLDKIMFYAGQKRTVLKACGEMDAEDMNQYIANGGYFEARNVLNTMTPEEVCQKVLDSGLRGRGGGGFPTGKKWELTLASQSDKKYVICNGDEGDPGAFMDRSIMEGNPHGVIEGMMIAAKAIGADEGYVYVRAEYPLAVKRVKKAVADARAAGILGKGVFGTDFNFDVTVMEGAGAFVCGEETALIASIEGKRGMPISKPPFPAQKGLFGMPTVINNVETLAVIPVILKMGIENYKAMGTEKSKGTKTFALTGHVANTGLIEVPLGTTLRYIVDTIGGGVLTNDGKPCGVDFKAVQIGGPSGGCLTPELLDMPLDYETLQSVNAMVGSGGLVVMNQETCIVSIAKFFMQFTQNESCGKCVVCREGTKQMLNLLDDITEGRATPETLVLLEELAHVVKKGSLCGLGKTAPNPVLSTLANFRAEYDAHVIDKTCPTGNCKSLAKYTIDAEKCKCCSLCARKCPVDAIEGAKGVPYVIDQEKCIKCGACLDACKFAAVLVG